MARAYLASVLSVVVEVAFGEQAVLVADESVARDEARVELDLYLRDSYFYSVTKVRAVVNV